MADDQNLNDGADAYANAIKSSAEDLKNQNEKLNKLNANTASFNKQMALSKNQLLSLIHI